LSRLLLVRHGETELSSSLRYWGKTDVALGAAGIKQAECLRRRLAAGKIDYIYSSSLKRAMLTAQTIAAGRNLAVTGCDELNEIDFGRIEGLTFAEVQVQFPQIARMWAGRDPALAYPHGESVAQLDERIAVFAALLARHSPNDTILIVAHSGVLRSLICRVLDMEMSTRWKIGLDLASLSIIDTYPETAILGLLNDTCHLKMPSTL
jgi:alpha-ribazole phosphatase